MGTLVALLLVAYLPGAVIFRLPWGNRSRRAALAADERVFWCVVLSVAWSCALALVLAAIGMYQFPLLLWITSAACVLAAATARFRLRLLVAAPLTPVAILPIVLVFTATWLYFPPAEYVMGGKDPGTYMNEGIQIAQRGAFLVRDPVVASVPRQFRDLFFPSHLNPTYYSLRFMGFFIQDPDTGQVVGQFPHLFPVSIAIAYGLNGLSGARQAVGVWMMLGLLATYYLGSRLLGQAAAFAATLLLAINVVTVWFGRYPNAEVVMLTLLGAALLAVARALVDGDRFFAPVAGLLLGLLMFLRFDAVLALGGVAAGLLAARATGRRIGWAFWATLWPLLLLACWYLAGPMRAYLAYPVVFAQNVQLTAMVTAAVGGLAIYLWAVRRPRVSTWVRYGLPVAYAVVLALLAAYAYFVRQPAGRTALHDAMALRTFAWYVTAPGLALAVAGLVITSVRIFWRDPTTFMTAALFAGFFFYKIRIVPDHFWMARRFLPVILPMTMLMAVTATFWLTAEDGPLRWLSRRSPRPSDSTSAGADAPRQQGLLQRTFRTTAACVLLLPVAWLFWSATRAIRHHVEYAGLIPRLEKMASAFGDEDLVLVESRNASDLHVLALPLAYIYARNVLVLNTPRPDKVALAGFLDWAHTRYRGVYFVGGGGTDLLSRRIGVEPIAGDRFQIPEYESARNVYPTTIHRKEFDYSVYRFAAGPPGHGVFDLDLGTTDDLLVVRFHAKERQADTGMTFRWSRDNSYVSILGIAPATQTLTVWMGDGGRPPQVQPAGVTVVLDGRTLGSVTVTREVRPYAFAIPPELATAASTRDEPARLRLTTTTWTPRVALGVPDDRDLGVMVDRVEAR